ncbi:hypothetical protein AAHE18_13G010500 [Arachis hypogaea]
MLCAPINPSDINRIQGVYRLYPVRPKPPTVGVRRRWGGLLHHLRRHFSLSR